MKTTLTAALLFLLIACNQNKQAKEKSAKVRVASLTNPEVKYGIEGFYTGDFEDVDGTGNGIYFNKITICIDSLDKENIYGHSIVAGNERRFWGGYRKDGDEFVATVKEPGDDKYDGVFNFSIFPDANKIKGVWTAYEKTIPVTNRTYELKRQVYKYKPSLDLPKSLEGTSIEGSYDQKLEKVEALTGDAIKFNASQLLLTSKDVENMYKADLEVMRNAIYARHGYSFKNPRMRNLFDNYVDWYMPVSTDVSSVLTVIEQKNIALIKRYEAHATKYYDEFGR